MDGCTSLKTFANTIDIIELIIIYIIMTDTILRTRRKRRLAEQKFCLIEARNNVALNQRKSKKKRGGG